MTTTYRTRRPRRRRASRSLVFSLLLLIVAMALFDGVLFWRLSLDQAAAGEPLEDLTDLIDLGEITVIQPTPSPEPVTPSPQPITGTGAQSNTRIPTPTPLTPRPVGATVTPGVNPTAPAAPDRRLSVLLIGLDGSMERTTRADVLMIATLDPGGRSAGLLSIPRDLYVTINTPRGAIRNKINTAYTFGQLYKAPGGGPGLAMRTVESATGVHIDHYALVDFAGFSRIIDALGGIDITVEKPLRDPFTGWSFKAGLQHMDGKTALRYARTRYMDSDFQRTRRQQQVILAIRDKVLSLNLLPRLPALFTSLQGAFATDLGLAELIPLAQTAATIDRNQIRQKTIEYPLITSAVTSGGSQVLIPREPQLHQAVAAFLNAR